mmetsp:Transcript_12281/g.31082  ORF Transcript_12281/g.31082 Transcript_12281/m.31082 type:complete len:225 (-) Transcript_12281:22-696(-)
MPLTSRSPSLPAVLARLVDADELDVEEQRLVDEFRVLQHKVERALPGEGCGLGPDTLVTRVVLRVTQRWRHHQLAHAALLHAHDALLECRDHDAGAELEAQKLLHFRVELSQLFGLKGPPKIANGVAGPINDDAIASCWCLAGARFAVLEQQAVGACSEVGVAHGGFAIVLAGQRRLLCVCLGIRDGRQRRKEQRRHGGEQVLHDGTSLAAGRASRQPHVLLCA